MLQCVIISKNIAQSLPVAQQNVKSVQLLSIFCNNGESRVYDLLFFAGVRQDNTLSSMIFLPINEFLFIEDNSFSGD